MKKHEEDDTKPASNFELNVLKLGKHRIQLVKGDRFTSNGRTFQYSPSMAENTVSAKKYKKDVLRADNIKMVIDRPLSPNEPADSEYNVLNRWREWEVQYAYVQPVDVIEPLVVLIVELPWKKWEFKTLEVEIERQTKELIFLKKSHPIHYRNKIERNELNTVVTTRSGTVYHVIGEMEKYNENELALWKQVESNQRAKVETAKELVRMEIYNLNSVLALKTDNGFDPYPIVTIPKMN